MFLETLLADSDGWNHMSGWGGGLMWLSAIVMMAAVVALIVVLARANTGITGSVTLDPTERARAILAERFANGDLTNEEYREKVNQLG